MTSSTEPTQQPSALVDLVHRNPGSVQIGDPVARNQESNFHGGIAGFQNGSRGSLIVTRGQDDRRDAGNVEWSHVEESEWGGPTLLDSPRAQRKWIPAAFLPRVDVHALTWTASFVGQAA